MGGGGRKTFPFMLLFVFVFENGVERKAPFLIPFHDFLENKNIYRWLSFVEALCVKPEGATQKKEKSDIMLDAVRDEHWLICYYLRMSDN